MSRVANKTPLTIICKTCTKSYSYLRSDRKGNTKQECNSCIVNRKRQSKKQELINLKGGKCSVCGYHRCNRALVFHHLDPEKKDFTINEKILNFSIEKLKSEADKCILLCSNCHMEVHAGLIEIDLEPS